MLAVVIIGVIITTDSEHNDYVTLFTISLSQMLLFVKLNLRGQAVLLCSTAKAVHGHPLHVSARLDVIRIRNQIRETCEQKENAESINQLAINTKKNIRLKHCPCWSGMCNFSLRFNRI